MKQNSEKLGFLYVANKQKFIAESKISSKSLKRFTKNPVCLICTKELYTEDLKNYFDIILFNDEIKTTSYISKIIGLLQTPFDRTLFLDCDTFIADEIDELFPLLDLVDFSCTTEPTLHTFSNIDLKYKNIFPEFHSGIILYKNNEVIKKLFNDWLSICVTNNIKFDMPGLREAVIENISNVRFSILPDHYNLHAFKTMVVLYNKVKIIHVRLGYKWGLLTPHFLSFEKMDKFAKRINKITYKRLYIRHLGIIPYNYTPANILHFLKKKLGFKHVSKHHHST